MSPDSPLMSAGLDSIGATELSTLLNERLRTELPSTLLFDHPTLRAIAGSLKIRG
ncbi:acyl carrier protein [bacterium]|nr:acyl carrier protein [bacterium]